MSRFRPPGDCPVCGSHVPAGRKSCPDCGASDEAGWNEDAAYDGVDLPDETFDYNAYLEREFGPPKVRMNRRTIWVVTAVVLFFALGAGWWWF